MRTRFLLGISAMLCLSAMFMATPAYANPPGFYADAAKQSEAAAGQQGAGYSAQRDPREIAALLIRGMLTLVGTIFVGYTIYAGVVILTSGGDSSKMDKGKSTLRTAVLGVMITLSAYALVSFVTNHVIQSATPTTDTGSYGQDLNTLLNPVEWLRGIRGDANNGLEQQRYQNRDPQNQQAITPFD